MKPPGAKRLADHGVIGDAGRAALVSTNGEIVWYAPHGAETAPACFSLVNQRSGGAIRIGPTNRDWTGTQTTPTAEAPILHTRFDTAEGSFEVVDHLDRDRIIRELTVLRGLVDVNCSIVPGHDFGPPRRVERWSNGIAFGVLRVEGMEPDVSESLHAGERRVLSVSLRSDHGVTRLAADRHHPTVGEVHAERDALRKRWRSTVGEVAFDSRLRDAVLQSVRALLVLQVPVGESGAKSSQAALLRALTTSLPIRTGNERNLDERFAWLRDNAHAVTLFERLECREIAAAHRSWLHDRTRESLPFAPMYRTGGDQPRSEEETVHSGWQEHGPVRVGARASMLDLGALAEASLVLDDRTSWRELERLGDWFTAHWSRANVGRWDNRAAPRRFVESTLAVHSALDALIRTARRRNPLDPVSHDWTDALRLIETWLRAEGCFGTNETAGWRMAAGQHNEDSVDAAVLQWLTTDRTVTLHDDAPTEASHRSSVTLDAAVHQLTEWPYTHRYLPHVGDGFPPGQGADLAMSFDMVAALAAFGRWDEAHERMEALLPVMGSTHIGASHVDPARGDLRGNLLYAPTHLSLIGASLALAHGPR